MAFRTNKTPVLQEKTASGSVASFNCALNKPLVACTTEFMCTQEGSGDPSPSNVRNIVGVDDITLTINGNTVVIDLDGTRYGGYVDVVRKKLVLTNKHDALSNYTWGYTPGDIPFFSASFSHSVLDEYAIKSSSINDYPFVTTDIYKYDGFGYVASLQNNHIITNGTGVYIHDDRYTSATNFINNMNSHYIVYELSTPIEISLSDIPTLSTIIGNNSFASDSGNISLKYNDLDLAKRGSFREVFKLPS